MHKEYDLLEPVVLKNKGKISIETKKEQFKKIKYR